MQLAEGGRPDECQRTQHYLAYQAARFCTTGQETFKGSDPDHPTVLGPTVRAFAARDDPGRTAFRMTKRMFEVIAGAYPPAARLSSNAIRISVGLEGVRPWITGSTSTLPRGSSGGRLARRAVSRAGRPA